MYRPFTYGSIVRSRTTCYTSRGVAGDVFSEVLLPQHCHIASERTLSSFEEKRSIVFVKKLAVTTGAVHRSRAMNVIFDQSE